EVVHELAHAVVREQGDEECDPDDRPGDGNRRPRHRRAGSARAHPQFDWRSLHGTSLRRRASRPKALASLRRRRYRHGIAVVGVTEPAPAVLPLRATRWKGRRGAPLHAFATWF